MAGRDHRQSTAGRLVTFALIVLGLFGTAYAIGERLPGHSHTGTTSSDGHTHTHSTAGGDMASMDGMSHDHSGGGDAIALTTSSDTSNGYTLIEEPGTPIVPCPSAGCHATSTFHLTAPDGSTVTSYDWAHGAYLHVVMVSPDLTRFEHVHPDIRPDGTWVLTAPDDNEWHVVLESTPTGATTPVIVTSHVAAKDAGSTTPAADLPSLNSTATVTAADGTRFVVDLRTTDTGLQFTITTSTGAPAEGLEAYLEQPAHLVAFRVDDLAYAHIHPTSEIGNPVITYTGALPSGTTYRLFLQFMYRGEVLTAPYTFAT
ncbi:MAG: hypothetical protein ACO3C1_11520 [Ilumatobacteraceae bacterium]